MKACVPPLMTGPNRGKPATGSRRGVLRHQAAGEEPCDACRLGARRDSRRWKNTRRGQTLSTGLPLRRGFEPPFVGYAMVVCTGCGTRGQANRGLLDKGQYTIPECVNCRGAA